MVPASSRTDPLMPPPPQSIVNVNATSSVCLTRPRTGIVCADDQGFESHDTQRGLPAVAGVADQPHQTSARPRVPGAGRAPDHARRRTRVADPYADPPGPSQPLRLGTGDAGPDRRGPGRD